MYEILSFERELWYYSKEEFYIDLKMYHDAIEELLDAQDARAKFLEKNCGFMYADDLREHNQREICKLLETNEPYAWVLMDLEHLGYKDKNLYSLTEIARKKNSKNPSYVIQAWLRDVKTLELLYLWEKEHNRLFEEEEANKLIAKTKEPSFTITAKVWIEKTSEQGIVSKQGKGGGTFAHHEIAIDFITWLFPEKRYQLSKMIINRILDLK